MRYLLRVQAKIEIVIGLGVELSSRALPGRSKALGLTLTPPKTNTKTKMENTQ